MKNRWILLGLLSSLLVAGGAVFAQDGGQETPKDTKQEPAKGEKKEAEPPVPEPSAYLRSVLFDIVPAWSSVEKHGNLTRLYQYRTIPEEWYLDMLAGVYREKSSLRTIARGYWRNGFSQSQTGFVELITPADSHSFRFWADTYKYFVDPTLDPTTGSTSSMQRYWLHWAGVGKGPGLDAKITDRRFYEPGIVRERPGPGNDYRVLNYDNFASIPLFRGDIQVGLQAVGLDDHTGSVPTSWSRDFRVGTTQSITDRLGASFSFSDVRIDQTGLGDAHATNWRADANWLVAPKVVWRAEGQISRFNLPFTLNRVATNRDRGSTDVTWRPTRWVTVQGGYTRKNWERTESGDPITQRPASNEYFAQARYMTRNAGTFRVRYRDMKLVDAPNSEIPFVPSDATLYFDHTQNLLGSWSKSFGYLTNVYASYNWVQKRNAERDFDLRYKALNVGLNTQVSPKISAFADLSWQDWSSNQPDFANLLNDGDDSGAGNLGVNRPFYSLAQVATLGANVELRSRMWLDVTLSNYAGHGGERLSTTFVSFDLRKQFFRDFSLGVGFQREVSSDHVVSGYGYDDNVFRVMLQGTFSGK